MGFAYPKLLEEAEQVLVSNVGTFDFGTLLRLESKEARYMEEFDEHAEKAKTLPKSTTNENKLNLYGLYKQATVGAVSTSRPGMFNMKDRVMWDAWKAVEGRSKEEAMGDYITKVKHLLGEAGAST
ncbi:acyl-CoA-binding protein [Malus domestica]|uniref:Acyl-CoA-binding protein 2 n=1 Tax=Malus domestica TaxID=3750 RepID=J7GYD5_MALDO|nr:acyl-CoA-binding protein [Malus domestica]AFP82243.1 acyl-CoA-binding protein 2 [Malus domestica]